MEGNKILHLMIPKRSFLVNYYRRYCKKSQDFKVFLKFEQLEVINIFDLFSAYYKGKFTYINLHVSKIFR